MNLAGENGIIPKMAIFGQKVTITRYMNLSDFSFGTTSFAI